MSKRDFHVVAYKILNSLYNSMKDGEDPDIDFLSAEKLEINDRYFNMVIKQLYDNGYIAGTYEIVSKNYEYIHMSITKEVYITIKGIEFLLDDDFLHRVKKYNMLGKNLIPYI